MFDLNDLVPPDLPWVLVEALDVNDSGQILVLAEPKEFGKAWYLLLTPSGVETVEEIVRLIISYDSCPGGSKTASSKNSNTPRRRLKKTT